MNSRSSTLKCSLHSGAISILVRPVVDLTIFDVQGRAVGRLFSGSLEPGAHAFPFDPVGEHLARGVYFVTLDWGGGREVERLVVGE
jgi:hypothetical protein